MAEVNNDDTFEGGVQQLVTSVQKEVRNKLKAYMSSREKLVKDMVQMIEDMDFEMQSIPAFAIDFEKARISGNAISGGTIKKFTSTGIEDRADNVQLTILDNIVVVEDKLVTRSLSVTEDVVIQGNVTIHGDMPLDAAITDKLVRKIGKSVQLQVNDNLKTQIENISGDNIVGGLHKEFRSTGIQDLGSKTQLTVMDDFVVVENNLLTQEITVKKNAVIDGDLEIKGKFIVDPAFSNDIVKRAAAEVGSNTLIQAESLADKIADGIQGSNLDVESISIKGKKLVNADGSLAKWIRDTRITKLGLLSGLNVSGEAYIYDTFYVGNNRVGVNTTEPAAALAVWDENVEILIGKHSKNTGYIGSLRAQEVILGAHNKTNIVLGTGGQTLINDLIADKTRFFSASKCPDFEGEPGSVCFNTKPVSRGPFGWICLGGAAWGIMGLIE